MNGAKLLKLFIVISCIANLNAAFTYWVGPFSYDQDRLKYILGVLPLNLWTSMMWATAFGVSVALYFSQASPKSASSVMLLCTLPPAITSFTILVSAVHTGNGIGLKWVLFASILVGVVSVLVVLSIACVMLCRRIAPLVKLRFKAA